MRNYPGAVWISSFNTGLVKSLMFLNRFSLQKKKKKKTNEKQNKKVK